MTVSSWISSMSVSTCGIVPMPYWGSNPNCAPNIGRTVHEHGQLYCPHNWVGGLTTIANIHLVAGVPSGHMCELNQTYNPLKWEIFKEPYPIENGWLTIPEKPGYGVEIIDDVAKRFPFEPGSYAKPNPKFKGTGLPLWWS